MAAIIILGLVAVWLVISVLVFAFARDEDIKIGAMGSGIAAVIIGAIVWVSFSFSTTPARNVGIEIEFGKATDTLTPGLNWVAPWAEVENFPTTSQVLDMDATDNTDSSKANPVNVKFKGGGAGAVNVNMNYHIAKDDDAIKLWNQWKDFDAVKNNVVNQKAQSIVYQIMGQYAPEDAVDGTKVANLNEEIKEKLNASLAPDGIVVENVLVKKVDVDPTIQDRINKQVSALADKNTESIKRDTANITAEKNRILNQSSTGQSLADKCLDVVNNWNAQKNGALPAGFSCLGASSVPLTVPAK